MHSDLQPIFHLVHIPRSGGATLLNSIRNYVSVPMISRGYQMERYRVNPTDTEITYLDKDWEEEQVNWICSHIPLDRPMLLYGHIHMGFNDYVKYPEYHYFTTIRHPIDRVWSRFNAYINAPEYNIYKIWEERFDLDILRILHAGEPELCNDTVRMISGTNRIKLDEGDLDLAIFNLEHEFSYAIDYEYLNDFFTDLSPFFPLFENVPIVPGFNHIGFDKVGGVPSKEITEAIRDYNLLDMKLYAYIHNKGKLGKLVT